MGTCRWALFFSLVACPAIGATSAEDLFAEAFGRKPGARQAAIAVQLEIDARPVGWSTVVVAPSAVRILAAPILEALAPRVREDIHARLTAAVEVQGQLTLLAIEEVGLTARYDPTRLLVQLSVPALLRRPVVDTLAGPASFEFGAPAPASTVSGFLNVRLAQDFSWGPSGDASVRGPFRVGLESAINVRGWVLEARGELAEAPEPLWSMGDVRLVKDDVEHAIRFVAGDFTTPGSGLLHGQALAGVAVARNFSLDPSQQALAQESIDFLLDKPSRVEVFVNGRLVETLQLEAGRHDLRGLILEGGGNELQLLITDELGAQKRVTKRVGLASGQLAPGVFEAASGLGIPLRSGTITRGYDWNEPTLCLSYRRGMSAALTLGGSLQVSPITQTVGIDQLWSTFYGSIGASAALSHRAGLGGYAAGLRYELQRRLGTLPAFTFGVGGEVRSADFVLPGDRAGARASTYAVNASFGQGLGGYYGRLFAQVISSPTASIPTVEGALLVSKGFSNGVGLALDLTARRRSGTPDELRARLNLVWAWPGERRSVQAVTELDQLGRAKGRLTVNQELNIQDANLRASAGIARDSDQWGTFESLGYRGQRAEASLSHRFGAPLAGGGSSNLLQARVGTAVVFADGVFAWSRPVTQSFAIVAANPGLNGQKVQLNASSWGYAGAMDSLGPAVLPDLEPYGSARVSLDAPELPVGYSLGPDVYRFRPTYRSGTLIRVGEEGSVFLRGTLLDPAGAPIALSSGSIVRVSEAGAASIPFFTNRTGRFVLSGLKPGRYALRLDSLSGPTEFEIPIQAAGLFELGQLRTLPARNEVDRME